MSDRVQRIDRNEPRLSRWLGSAKWMSSLSGVSIAGAVRDQILIETLRDITAIGVDFASVTEGLDLSTPTGRAMVGMLSVFAQFEREVMV